MNGVQLGSELESVRRFGRADWIGGTSPAVSLGYSALGIQIELEGNIVESFRLIVDPTIGTLPSESRFQSAEFTVVVDGREQRISRANRASDLTLFGKPIDASSGPEGRLFTYFVQGSEIVVFEDQSSARITEVVISLE